jgi:dihydroneopterin aldolase
MDSILLKHIEVWTKIGVPDEERNKPQRLFIDVELFHSTKETAESDDMKKGIDYAAVVQVIQALAETERKTIERFAQECAASLLRTFKPSGGVQVSVWKHPPLLPLEAACVTIQRP